MTTDTKSLDDSGCFVDEERVVFNIDGSMAGKSTSKKMIHASKDESLASAIKRKLPAMDLKSYKYWAEVVGHTGPVCVNPYSLKCESILPESYVKYEKHPRVIYDYDVEHTKPYSKFFFVSTDNFKGRQAITHVHYKDLHCKDICVGAYFGQKFEDALKEDGRFKNVERFVLKRKETEASVALDDQFEKCIDNLSLVIKVRKAVQSVPQSSGVSKVEGCSEGLSAAASSTPRKSQSVRKDKLALAETLWEKKTLYAFSKSLDELTREELMEEMKSCLKAAAWATLLGPGRSANYEKKIEKLAQTTFSNHNVVSRRVAFSKQMHQCYDSIGHLRCGNIVATCFLISKNMVATNWHVVDDIERAQCSSEGSLYSVVKVFFDYDDPAPEGLHQESGITLLPFECGGNVICSELDFAFLHLEENVKNISLGPCVSTAVPEAGMVSIVGHPSGLEKQEELCPILPLHDDRRSLEINRRVSKRVEQHFGASASCYQSLNRDQISIQMCHNLTQELPHKASVTTYDVGKMLEGSSGSPVFDMGGKIIAIHTTGFRLFGGSSIVEVGVTFKAIVDYLRENGREDVVRKYFPNCDVESMDVVVRKYLPNCDVESMDVEDS